MNLAALLLAGCRETPAESAPVPFCDSGPALVYEPSPETLFTTWPDDYWRVPTSDTPTGWRLGVGTDEYPATAEFAENFVENFDHATTLDGFGTTTPVAFQFAGDVSGLVTTGNATVAAHIGADWVPWPIDVTFVDGGFGLFLTPRFPLPDATEVVALVSNDGEDCIQPSASLQSTLQESSPLGDRLRAAVSGVGEEIAAVGALSVFTTQSATAVSVAVSAAIGASEYAPAQPGACVPYAAGIRQCDLVLPVDDFRDADHIVPGWDGEVLGGYDLPVRVWLPDAQGPWPVLLCGHGLGGDKDDCTVAVDIAGAEGWAVVAIDAVEHGDHPLQTEADLDLIEPLKIFAIRAIPPGINGLRLRDNFRQSAWDKLMVVRAIEGGLDVDGEGSTDLDAEHLVYLGASLGGIMGPEPLALSDGFDAGILFVGGGRLTQIIEDSVSFAPLVAIMAPPEWSDGDLARAFPQLQALVDGGDAMTFGPRVLLDRFHGSPPHTVLMLAHEDEVVPNSTNENLARALGLPGLGREIWPIPGVSFSEGPLSENVAGASAAVIQFDELTIAGAVVNAEHDNVHESEEAAAIIREVLAAVLAGRAPVLRAPALQ